MNIPNLVLSIVIKIVYYCRFNITILPSNKEREIKYQYICLPSTPPPPLLPMTRVTIHYNYFITINSNFLGKFVF